MKTYKLCVTYVECVLCMCTGVQYLRIKLLFTLSLDTVSLTEPWDTNWPVWPGGCRVSPSLPPNTVITSKHSHSWLLMWVLMIQTQALILALQAFWAKFPAHKLYLYLVLQVPCSCTYVVNVQRLLKTVAGLLGVWLHGHQWTLCGHVYFSE